MTPTLMLFWLLVAHCLCDYPLQGDFLSRAKNHTAPIPGVPWYQALGAHALIHAGAVFLVTGSSIAAALELFSHYQIDFAKSAGMLGTGDRAFNVDQAVHVWCKVLWVLVVVVLLR